MTNFSTQTSRALHDDHAVNLQLLGRAEQAFGRAAGAGAASDAELLKLLALLARELEHDVKRHFEFEEQELFPRLTESGDGGMAALLMEEHVAIRAVAAELLPLAHAAPVIGLDAAGRDALKRTVLELAERLVSHIQKEEMALLPLIDDLLDEETDRQLAFGYAAG